jgi:hypothetical protein
MRKLLQELRIWTNLIASRSSGILLLGRGLVAVGKGTGSELLLSTTLVLAGIAVAASPIWIGKESLLVLVPSVLGAALAVILGRRETARAVAAARA